MLIPLYTSLVAYLYLIYTHQYTFTLYVYLVWWTYTYTYTIPPVAYPLAILPFVVSIDRKWKKKNRRVHSLPNPNSTPRGIHLTLQFIFMFIWTALPPASPQEGRSFLYVSQCPSSFSMQGGYTLCCACADLNSIAELEFERSLRLLIGSLPLNQRTPPGRQFPITSSYRNYKLR